VHELTPAWIANALATERWRGNAAHGPGRATIDSREAGDGDLFFGLPGERHAGSEFAAQSLAAGAWGAVVEPAYFEAAAAAAGDDQAVFAVADPTAALGSLARAWRRELGATVIGVTGSTGKTTTKDILAALAARTRNVVATPGNLNTEIGLPLVLLGAARGTDAIVLEMAMRGAGQIGELARIAEPDVGCIVNVGPVHLEQLGSVEAVAAAKAELIDALRSGAGAVVPAGEPLLGPHIRSDLHTLAFGEEGDVWLAGRDGDSFEIALPSGTACVRAGFTAPHLVENLLAAAACCELAGIAVDGPLEVNFSGLRGEIVAVLGGVTLINDCYNANPVSLRAALDQLSGTEGRRIAVLGGMAELGERSAAYHADLGAHADAAGVATLVTVGDLARGYELGFGGERHHVDTPLAAAALLRELALPGDTVLVKGSRSVGLEAVAERLVEHDGGDGG
jgi:UDP-N-acetylmuramoyl-tripeptide--D-alanyl-D-alanine ligase